MTFLQAILLGLVQGLTEFLPVSSSAHLILVQKLFGLEQTSGLVTFDLICHLGTLLAIVFIFMREFKKTLSFFFLIVVGTLPLVPLVLIVKPIKQLFDAPEYMGCFFLLTAALLWLASRYGWDKKEVPSWKDAFTIGCFQALAIVPGISRSGATIAGARLLGWPVSQAIFFSFLLSVPAILGGTAYEWLKSTPQNTLPLSLYLAGFLASFASGWLTLSWLLKQVNNVPFHYFIWYLSGLGLLTLYLFY